MIPPPSSGVVIAHGVDLTEVARIARLLERHPGRFLERCFTEAERAYCLASKRRDEHLAARFAAKEAVFKALGTGWAQGLDWKDAEVTRSPAGVPGIALANRAAAIAAERGITGWLLSLSHTRGLALASALALGTARAE